ncbi:TPA: endonuclease III [Candidatus Bathyarchaeota archaeon]|nr:endonuclease III [Candidatus Bathyarchaeota archaeon]
MHEMKNRAEVILERLKALFRVPDLSEFVKDPFKVLVRTIISQSTAEINTRRAYANLSKLAPVTPKALSRVDVRDLQKALRVAGLYRNKSRLIKEMAQKVLDRFSGSLDFIYTDSLEDARRKLLDLPGVGFKTADIVLLFCAGKPVLPVDTHVNRVSKRLRLTPPSSNYETVRISLQNLFRHEEYFNVHMLLIALGRKYCKAIKPSCHACPVKDLCPSAVLRESSE